MNKKTWNIVSSFILILGILGCKKTNEEDKVVIKDGSSIKVQTFSPSDDKLYAKLMYQSSRDTVMKMSFDVNNDKELDFELIMEIQNIDSFVWVNKYAKRLHNKIELQGDFLSNFRILNAYMDTNNYIAPSTVLWKTTNNDELHVLTKHKFGKCVVNGAPNYCLMSKVGNFIDNSIQYFAFRVKVKSDDPNLLNWNYGYAKIEHSAVILNIRKIALETEADKPIMLGN